MSTLTADLFRATWPRFRAKRAASAADRPIATAKCWVRGLNKPDADTLLRMAKESAELRAELVRLLGEWNTDADTVALGTVDQASRPVAGRDSGCAGPTTAAVRCAVCPATSVWDGVTERRRGPQP